MKREKREKKKSGEYKEPVRLRLICLPGTSFTDADSKKMERQRREQIKFRSLPFICVNLGRAGKLIYFRVISFFHIYFSLGAAHSLARILLDNSKDDLFFVWAIIRLLCVHCARLFTGASFSNLNLSAPKRIRCLLDCLFGSFSFSFSLARAHFSQTNLIFDVIFAIVCESREQLGSKNKLRTHLSTTKTELVYIENLLWKSVNKLRQTSISNVSVALAQATETSDMAEQRQKYQMITGNRAAKLRIKSKPLLHSMSMFTSGE